MCKNHKSATDIHKSATDIHKRTISMDMGGVPRKKGAPDQLSGIKKLVVTLNGLPFFEADKLVCTDCGIESTGDDDWWSISLYTYKPHEILCPACRKKTER